MELQYVCVLKAAIWAMNQNNFLSDLSVEIQYIHNLHFEIILS